MAPSAASLLLNLRHLDHSSPSTTSTPTSAAMSGHGNHGSSGGDSSGEMHSMPMAFQTNIHTPLYSASWTPQSTGAYVGTVIFLILLSFLHRFLVAYKAVYLKKIHEKNGAAVVVVAGKSSGSVKSENVVVEEKKTGSVWMNTPWRFSTELPRAALGTVTAGIGYLLMLAVMTFNVGFFISVLAGLFVGELVWGRFYGTAGDH